MNRPKSVVCYICGREYGTHSIEIHIKSCISKWEKEQALKPKKDRKPVPQPPQALGQSQNFKAMDQKDLEAYNSNAATHYNDVSLIPCENCGRTFKEEALAHHIKGCSVNNPYKAGTEKQQNLVPCSKCGRKFAAERVSKHQSVCNGQSSGVGGGQTSSSSSNTQQSKSSEVMSNQSMMRPKALMCYICGREYGTKSLGIHLKTCKEKYLIEQEKKPKSERKQIPSEPAGLQELLAKPNITHQDIEDYNNGAYNKYNTEGLEMCENCGRTFTSDALAHHKKACSASKPFEGGNMHPCSKCGRKFVGDRIKKHESVCKGDGKFQGSSSKPQSSNNLSSQQQKSSPEKPKVIQRPKTLVCYICGREYGTTSLKIHIPQCEKKWINEQAKLPKSQQRPVPQPPKSFGNLENATQDDINRFNDQAFDQYNTSSLLKCENCQRTFTAEALKHHQKACTKENPAKMASGVSSGMDKLNIGGKQDFGEEVVQQQDLVPCEKCGRKFAGDRVQKHENICKGKR